MDKIKKIYYPILAVLFAVALVLGFVAASVNFGGKADKAFTDGVKSNMEMFAAYGEHNSFLPKAQEDLRTDIELYLDKAGLTETRGSKDSDYENATADGITYLRQETTLDTRTFEAIAAEDEVFFADKTIVNIIVYVPGASEETVLFTANLDTAAKSESGTEMIQAAAMMQIISDIAKDPNYKPEKTLVFLFTDCENEGAFGAYAFRNQFKGFGGVADKVALAINFGAKGTGRIAVESDGVDLTGIKAYASGLTGALEQTYGEVSDYDAYEGTPRLNVFFSGSRDKLDTSRDTIAAVKDGQIAAMGGIMKSLVERYESGKIAVSQDKGTFSYLGMTVQYKNIVSYILGAIALVLLVAAIFELVRNGKKAIGLVRGFFAQISALVITAIILYACYFVLSLLLVGFGALPLRAITDIIYMNIGLFISSLILAFAAYTGVTLLIRRLYKVKAIESARGGALLLMLAGIVMAFAMPSASMIFVITAILEGIMLILVAELGKKFKEKHDDSIEKLFLYTLPLILLTPAMIPVLYGVTQTVSEVYLPLVLLTAMLGMSVIVPYVGLTKAIFERVASKLPKHTVRVERVRTVQQETGAKKGRGQVQTIEKREVVNERVEWHYRNRYGVTFAGIIAALLIILFAACPARHLGTNITGTFSYRESAKDDAIVYVWDQVGLNAVSEQIRIYDKAAYRFAERVDGDFTWDPIVGAYQKPFLTSSTNFLGTSSPIGIAIDGADKKALLFTTYDGASDSVIDIRLSNMSEVSKITIRAVKPIEIENDGKDEIYLQLPYDENNYGSFTIEFDFQGTVDVGVDYTQRMTGTRAPQLMDTLNECREVIRGVDGISSSLIFHKQNNYTLG